MKCLTMEQIAEKTKLIDDLQAKQEKLDEAIHEFNVKSLEIWNRHIDPALNALNAAAEALNTFRSDLYLDMEAYHDEKSEKWQESEAGQQYAEWMANYAETVEGVELEAPLDIEPPEVEYSDIADATDEPG